MRIDEQSQQGLGKFLASSVVSKIISVDVRKCDVNSYWPIRKIWPNIEWIFAISIKNVAEGVLTSEDIRPPRKSWRNVYSPIFSSAASL